MIGKNNSYLYEVKKGTKVETYSIKKFKIGAASVVIGASIFFGAGSVAQAGEISLNNALKTIEVTQGSLDVPKVYNKPILENTKESVASAVASKVGTKISETKVTNEEKSKVETVKKEILKASIVTLEEKLKSAQDTDKIVIETAKEVIAAAKVVVTNEKATQSEIDIQVQKIQDLSTVVTEAKVKAFDKKLEEKKEAEQRDKEATATKKEKEVAEVKKELTQVASEAEVTNTLAKTELNKKDLKVEAKPAVQAVVVKNEEAIKLAKELLGNDKATKEQIANSLAELSNSIKAVYTQLEKAGVKRSGKFDVSLTETEAEPLQDASTETGKKWLADHGYTSLTDIPIKTKERNAAEIKNLNGQIQWLDFGDKKAWTKLKENGQLQVGSVFEKEIIPGYTVKLTVKELKPFDATDVYKRRVAGTAYQNSYKPDGENRVDANNGKPTVTGIGGVRQGYWSETKNSGLDTGKAKTTIGGVGADGVGRDATVAGVKFTIEAKYNGKLIKPSIVMTSGEQIGDKETEIYTTNGTPWDLLALIGHGQAKHYLPLNRFNTLFDPRSMKRLGDQAFVDALAAGKFATPDSATAGLGSQVFGGYTNMDGRATPIVSSNNVTEVGFYLLTTGQQSSMLGIKISDYGDLPKSYGEVEHYLKTKTLDSVTGAEKQIQQPYLGTVKADPESNPGRNVFGENSDDETDYADEGVEQLMPSDFIVRNKETGLSAIRPILGPNNTHKIKIKASANGNENFNGPLEKAYVRGFIDFNNNGKFDQGEESDIKEVTGNNQIVELTFHNTHVIDENNDIIKFRVRIATDRTQVENPTGIAYSGEVEDNQVQVTNPPRGDYEETTGKQGDKQRISFEYISHNKGDEPGDLGSKNGSVTFNSYGKIDYTQERNSITAETTKTAQGGVRIVNETGQLVTNLNVPGQGTYEVSDTGVTFTPDPAFVGKASGVVLRAVDANGQSTGWEAVTDGDVLTNTNNGGHSAGNNKSMDAVYVPIVEPKEMTGHSKETTGLQGKEQKGIPLFKVNAGREAERIVSPSTQYIAKLVDPKSGSIINETSITVENEGTYTIVPETGEVKFQPLLSFKGTAGGVTVELTGPVGFDKDGVPSLSTARAKYIPTVIAVSPTAEAATSTGIQGEVQTGKPIFKKGHEEVPIKENSIKLLNSDGDEVTETPALGEGNKEVGKYTVDSSTGIVTFTPTDKSYIGTVVPARVQAKDINETKVETKYTPSIVGVKPQASPATSTGIQGEIQEGTVTFTAGKAVIGDVEKSVPIKVGSSKLIGSDGTEVTEVPAYANDGVKQVGTYSIAPGTNKVIFTPTDKTYTGTVLPVDVQAEDENGTKVRTTYTPHILGVSPTAKPAVSKDIQGKEQTKEVLFKPGKTTIDGVDKEVPLDSSTFKLLDENGQERDSVPAKSSDGLKEIGTYRINVVDNKPVVVFTPSDKTYTGEVREVTIQVKDTNGSKVTTTYTPTIVPVRPISTPVRSIGVQGLPQEGTSIFTAGKAMLNGKEVEVPLSTKAPKLVNPETGLPIDEKSIKVPNEGTYTIDENGKVTFMPEPQFTGVANGVEVQREDQNGTSVNAKYTPTVKGVTPTSKDVTSIGDKGEKQFGTPVFKAGSTTINNEKVEVPIDENVAPKLEGADEEGKVVIPKEGIYTIDATGKVTFTPENDFVGVATGVTVKRVDKNGTLVTATYTPTVLGKTTTENVISEGAKNQPQSNTPLFKGDIDTTVPPTFEDKTKEKVISGQGTYTINDEGVVTFTPEKDYVGTATAVEVVRKDKNGRTIKATYTPTVRPETKYVTVENNGKETELIPTKDGKYPEEKIEGYRVIKTETDEKGNTKHIYEKVNTFFKDKEGNEIPKYPSEPGTVDKKDIPEYRFVESKKLPNGDTEHVYEKVNTFFKDKEGNEIPKYPSEPGTVDKKDIPEYRFVESKKLPNGDTEHVYEKVNTFFKDKEGNEIPKYPSEPGTVDKKDIPEYRFVESKKLPNGDTEHVYEKVNTFFKDKEGNEIPKYPSEPGTVDKKDIPEYRFVESKKLPNGDTEHVYEKVNTFFKDKEGNEIPKYPSEPGTVDKKDIPEYRFVESKKLPNGDTEHVYEKVNTFFKDKEGNEIPKYPSEPGTVDKKDIPEYRFVESKKLPNGDTEHVYEKVNTFFKDKEGNEIPKYPSEPGTVDKKDIPEYRFVESKKLPNGDTEHVYEKVNTFFKDKEGNEIPKYPSEPGTVDKKDIPEYRFVESKKLPNGDTEHIYEKVNTFFKDKEGNEIPKYPSEPGTVDKKDIPEYRFVESKKLPNGDTEHVYEKVNTFFKDKEGNEIPKYPSEPGTVDKKDIPEYRFVESKKLPNGDTEHVYEKVNTFFKDKEGNEIPRYPSEPGTVDKKDIPEYRFVESKKLPNGDTEHIYEKVNTFFKDKEGNEIPKYPSEPGTVDKKDIPEYRFVESKKLPNGDTEHIYEKVNTFFKDKEGNEIPKYPSEPGIVDKKDIPEYRFVESKKLPNGDTEHVYEKVKTSFKDKEGNEIPKYPSEPGTVDKKDIPEYRFVESKKLPNGDTEHVYEKVNTFFKDKEGNEIPKYPSEPGTVDKKDIPEYRFVESKKLPNGDTEHIYEKVNTFFKDKEGNEIPKYPSEPGTVDKKDIPEYRFVESKKLPNGDTEHVYEKVNTFFKDKEGNEIPKYPSEPGTVDKKDIPEYRFVETKKLPNGDTEHIYEKVNTFFKDKEGNEIPKYPSEPGTVDKKDIPEYRFVESKKLPNGDTEHVYEKVNTFFKDKEGNEIPKYPSEPGTVDKKDIPEYRFVESKKLPNGDTEHIYEKVNTFFKDKEGNEIPKYPSEPGTVDKKDIPEYRFVESKKLPNGDTEHVYEKVNTFFKDKEGNEIPKYPSEPGTVDKKDIPEYRFVESKKLPNGDTEHIYEKVNTFFKDKEGNEIPKYPSEPGTVDKKDIPEYRFVESKKLPNGDTEHIYEKVNTFFKDKEGNEIPKYPSEPGTVDKKDIPEYRFVESKKLPNGDTEHVYEKVNTFFKDKEGNEIPKYPSEPGTVDKKDIPEYRFVESKKLPNGDTEHIYEKVNTFFKDKEGNEIPKYPSEPGTVDKKDIPEYRFVESKKLPNGDTEHIYEKVNTFFKDKEGNEIPKYPSEPGTVDKKDIPEYRFVESKKLPNGDTEHVYEKVNTFFKDKEGNEIPKYPSEPGTVDKKDIPEYRFVESKKLPNGDTEHIYEKVNTFFKDKEGNEIPKYPSEPGTVDKKDIPEYRFVESKKLPNGDTEHIYEKVNTFFKDKEGNEIPKYPSEPGTVDKKDIPEYRFVESKKLPNGDTEHIYEKIKLPRIIARDKEGNIIPGFEYDMLSPILEIPEYRYTGEEKLPDGTIKRIYEPILTIHKDKQGNPIPNVPEIEKGIKRSRNIPGYRLVKTKILPNGDIEHVYEKNSISVVEKITKWTDDNGNLLKPSEKGLVNSGEIEGYEFVRTVEDEVGNIQHIFKKKSRIPESSRITIWTDEDGNELRLSEKGTRGIGMIEGYEFVRTVIEENGNLRHIFKKVSVTAKKVQIKRLANTGTETTNVVGLGVLLAGIATVIKKRRKKY